jgi:hypothetical protein
MERGGAAQRGVAGVQQKSLADRALTGAPATEADKAAVTISFTCVADDFGLTG